MHAIIKINVRNNGISSNKKMGSTTKYDVKNIINFN